MNLVKRLAILGASGHGKVVADTAELSEWKEIVFFDDAWPKKLNNTHWSIIGNTEKLLDSIGDFDGVIVAIGHNQIREQKTNLLIKNGASLVNIVHPSAVISSYADIGKGTVVFANVVVNTDVKIASSAILNTASSLDHDCKLGNAVHISPGVNLAGGVSIGSRSWIGIGACVRQCIDVGRDVMIGAGSVVVKNIPDNFTVMGNPARTYKNSQC